MKPRYSPQQQAFRNRFPTHFSKFPTLGVSLTLLGFSSSARADFSWDSDTGASNVWNATDVNWDTNNDGVADGAWVSNSDAVFSEAPEAITVGTANSFNSITFATNGWTIGGAGAGFLDIDGTDNASSVSVTNVADSATIGEVIRNAGGGATAGSLTKNGAGILTLTATNTFTGGTTVTGGTIRTTGTSALGGSIALQNGTTWELANSAAATYANVPLSVAGTARMFSSGSNLAHNYQSAISGATGSILQIETTGASGQITLGGSMTGFSGTLQVLAGSFARFNQTTNGGTGGNNTGSTTAVFDVNGTLITRNTGNPAINLGALTGASTGVLRSTGSNLTGTATGTATFSIGALNTNTTYNGSIVDTATAGGGTAFAAVTKVGTGSLALGGSNTYSGITNVNGGTLLVNGTNSGGGGYTVGASGTLGGSGSIGASSINVSGVLSPGASVGTFASGTLNFATGSTFAAEVNSAVAASSGSDLQIVSGGLNLTGTVNLTLVDVGVLPVTFTPGTVFSLLNYSGAWNGGLFTFEGNSLADDTTFSSGLNTWQIDYNAPDGGLNFTGEYLGGSDSFVNITAVPEPASMLLGALGMMVILRRRRN